MFFRFEHDSRACLCFVCKEQTFSENSLAKNSYLCIVFYNDIEKLILPQFKRLTGIEQEVFEQMLEVLNETKAVLRKHPGIETPPKLSHADKLLLLLMYFRNAVPSFISE